MKGDLPVHGAHTPAHPPTDDDESNVHRNHRYGRALSGAATRVRSPYQRLKDMNGRKEAAAIFCNLHLCAFTGLLPSLSRPSGGREDVGVGGEHSEISLLLLESSLFLSAFIFIVFFILQCPLFIVISIVFCPPSTFHS